MVNKIIEKLMNWSIERRKTPWASFEVIGFADDGQVKILFNWNKPFIEKIHAIGFQAETEEDSVQMFFYASQMRPTSLFGDDEGAKSEAHPNLDQDKNIRT